MFINNFSGTSNEVPVHKNISIENTHQYIASGCFFVRFEMLFYILLIYL